MHTPRQLSIALLIIILGFAPLATACSPFGDDDDDNGDDPTATVAVADTPEVDTEETPTPDDEAASPVPEDEESPEPDGEETVTGDPSETPSGPAPGGETPEAPDDATPGATEGIDDPLAFGQDVFDNVCAACHQPEGEGIEGIYPALAGSPFVTLDAPEPVIGVIITGRGGMPRFADSYTDAEIAAIVSYIRTAWENDASEVDAETVQQVRESVDDTAEDESATGGEQTDDSN